MQEGIQNKIVDNAATDATGVKLSYTVPAGKTARLLSASWFNNSGTPTVRLEIVRGGTTVVLRQDTASYREGIETALDPGDVVRFNVTVAAAASSTADAQLSVIEG